MGRPKSEPTKVSRLFEIDQKRLKYIARKLKISVPVAARMISGKKIESIHSRLNWGRDVRSPEDIRAAIRTLERTVVALPRDAKRDVILGEIAALKYVLGEEETVPTLETVLSKWEAIHAEYDAFLMRS